MVTSENNHLHANRLVFQTNINIQNRNYKHAHTQRQTQKHAQNIHKNLYNTYTETYTHVRYATVFKRSFLPFLSISSPSSGKQYEFNSGTTH